MGENAPLGRLAALVVALAGVLTLATGCSSKVSNEDLAIARAAAALGYVDAQQLLGDMYLQGHGVPLDYDESAKWYRKAAEQGRVAAQNNLGVAYLSGFGMPQDNVEAYAWFSIAADQGFLGAAAGRDEAAKWMTNTEHRMLPSTKTRASASRTFCLFGAQ